jgi:hypothetical protein
VIARLTGCVLLFGLAAFFAIRSWNPLSNGYLLDYKDSPDGVYLTMAGIGASIAALFAAAGVLVWSRWFRRHGGFLLVAGLATIASVLPYVLFKWTSEPETWPWAFLVQDWIGWLRFAPRPRSDGLLIQAVLAVVVLAAVAGQFVEWSRREPAGSAAVVS